MGRPYATDPPSQRNVLPSLGQLGALSRVRSRKRWSREVLVPIGAFEFATSAATLDDTNAQRASTYFDLLQADRFARAIFLVGVSRGAVEDELVHARLRAVREAIEARADPTWESAVQERVDPPSDENPPDTVRVFLLCPASRPSA